MTDLCTANQDPDVKCGEGSERHSKSAAELSKSDCWTCRRRRVGCDRALPTCQKCQKKGVECLGYKKPLVWNKGVASRGKMMGKDFPEVPSQKLLEAVPTIRPKSEVNVTKVDNDLTTLAFSSPHPATGIDTGTLKILIDPIFQDMKPVTRYYLDYYAQNLCLEAVLHDYFPAQNPFRRLMAMVQTSPLILKVILAASARHAANYMALPNVLPAGWPPSSTSNVQHVSSAPFSYHAFQYKQVALAQLREDLTHYTSKDQDTVVASIALLVWLDILESGRDSWRMHIDGLKQLMQSYEPSTEQTLVRGRSSSSLASPIDSYFFNTCITCDIIGTTLSTPYSIAKPMLPTQLVYNSLKRSESMSFIGCPADILYLILQVNWHCCSLVQNTQYDSVFGPLSLSTSAPDSLESTYTTIIANIQSFDPIAWSHATTIQAPLSDLPQRIHLSSAFKSAALIYAIRVLNPTTAQTQTRSQYLPTLSSLSFKVLTHLSSIPLKHPFFKCILWPAFVAGAETVESPAREIAKSLIHSFWLELKAANVANAAAVLEQIWRGTDGEGGDVDGGGWTEHLARGGADWLFL